AFDSTINTNGPSASPSTPPLPFYFQRQFPDSPTDDWTRFQRNQDLVKYLAREMKQPIPGLGSNLTLDDTSRWGSANGDWIALNCFDFSRSLVNQYTYNQSNAAGSGNTAGSDYLYSYTGVQTARGLLNNTVGGHAEPNAYSVVPLHVSLNGGPYYTTEGAFPSLKEVSLVFYATERNPATPPTEVLGSDGRPTPTTDYHDPRNWRNLITCGSTQDKSQTKTMQAVMLLSFSGMAPGVYSSRGITYFSPVFWVKVTRAGSGGSFRVNGTDINFPASGAGNVVQYSTMTNFQTLGGGFMASMPASLFTTAGLPKTFTPGLNSAGNWSLTSPPITVSAAGDTSFFSFTGAPIQVDIYAPARNGRLDDDPTTDASLLISSQTIDFNAWNVPSAGHPNGLPVPIAPRWNVKQAAAPTVKMPSLDFTPSDGSSMASVNGWQAEVVPIIQQIGQAGSLPTVTNPRPTGLDPRLAPTSYTMQNTVVSALVYAFRDNVSINTTADPSANDKYPLMADFTKRVTAYW
ncbi:MAG: hypothetical protein INR62_13735, partial [Rhodospirillales bacterium]|nr:hypothetical protein [Acetobacter sp.]